MNSQFRARQSVPPSSLSISLPRAKGPLRVMLYSNGRSGVGQTVRAIRLSEYLRHAFGRRVEILNVIGIPNGQTLFETGDWPVLAPPTITALSEAVAAAPKALNMVYMRNAAAETLEKLVTKFDPDIFVTTTHRGVAGELVDILDRLRARNCRLILALRDIYFPARYVSDYASMSGSDFDAILVAGPPDVRPWLPPALLKGPLQRSIIYSGYLRPITRTHTQVPTPRIEHSIRCQVGGGRDGYAIALATHTAVEHLRRTLNYPLPLKLFAGPLMTEREYKSLVLAAANTKTHVTRWTSSREMCTTAESPTIVVSMAGYNSCVEAGWTGVSTLLVARIDNSDQEQEIRARLFSRWFANIEYIENRDDSTLLDNIIRSIRLLIVQPRPSSDPQSGRIFANLGDTADGLVGSEATATFQINER